MKWDDSRHEFTLHTHSSQSARRLSVCAAHFLSSPFARLIYSINAQTSQQTRLTETEERANRTRIWIIQRHKLVESGDKKSSICISLSLSLFAVWPLTRLNQPARALFVSCAPAKGLRALHSAHNSARLEPHPLPCSALSHVRIVHYKMYKRQRKSSTLLRAPPALFPLSHTHHGCRT